MKWCRFQTGQQVSYGIVEDDRVVEVTGGPFAEHTVTRTSYSLSQVKLLPPVIPPMLYAMSKAWRGGVGQPHTTRPGLSPIFARCMRSSALRKTLSYRKTVPEQCNPRDS
jgi:Rv2993c-like, N-terminal